MLRLSPRSRTGSTEPDQLHADQFAVLLPETHVQGALSVAEKIWRAIGSSVFTIEAADGSGPVELRVTASIGAAFLPSKDVATPDDLVKHAGEALYQAQRSGRNSICLANAQVYRSEAGGQ